MKLATTTLDFYQYTSSQQESMEYLHKAGFKYLDYSFPLDYGSFYGHDGQKFGIFAENHEAHIESVNKKADELGVKFIQAHSPLGTPLAKDNDEFINDTIKCIYSCKKLGIKNLVVHSGYLPDISKKQTFNLNREFFLSLLQHAEKCDVNILVENFNKTTAVTLTRTLHLFLEQQISIRLCMVLLILATADILPLKQVRC